MAFDTVFIANRGEIAVRLARSIRARGARAVGVYSDPDRGSLHASVLDEAIHLSGDSLADTYLDAERLIESAKALNADAVHPGYGFLSENAEFASRCVEAGLVFIGPGDEAIRLMGDKARAKRVLESHDVPMLPGYSGEVDDVPTLRKEAEAIGLPLLIKAAAGGGGRGMRRVSEFESFEDALASARREAQNAFGDGRLILERWLERPRHVEVQIVADTHGQIEHLFERECSVQRRHQKIIEEAPSPAVNENLRRALGAAAVRAARAINYVGVGTVEFLLDESGAFYFIEMNTRLQVEHPVTEEVTGLDLVDLQLAIAEGEVLPELPARPRGHAIEVRLYAEDPYDAYRPQTGALEHVRWSEEVRVDAGIASGSEVSSAFDPMLGKLIAFGATRERARLKLLRALEDTAVLGVGTNQEFLYELLRDPVWVAGDARTNWLDDREDGRRDRETIEAIGAFRFFCARSGRRSPTLGLGRMGRSARLRLGAVSRSVRLVQEHDATTLTIDARHYSVGDAGEDFVELDGHRYRYASTASWVGYRAQTLKVERVQSDASERSGGDGRVRAPMAGRVIRVFACVDTPVGPGETLVVLEAMKMEHELKATFEGVVAAVHVQEDEQVEARQLIVEVRKEP